MSDRKINCEQAELLMMGLIDGELSSEELDQINRHFEECPTCAREYESFKHLKKETDSMKLVNLPKEYWDEYWTHIYNRLERGIGWIFFSIGAILAISFAFYEGLQEFFKNQEVSLILKIGIALLLFGSIILLISVFREKLMVRKVDKYRSVLR